jgi:hypothetical protein
MCMCVNVCEVHLWRKVSKKGEHVLVHGIFLHRIFSFDFFVHSAYVYVNMHVNFLL